ncbi:MAG: hypothetical protein ACOCWQ_05985 [Nanoarchaeota archaeon]
MPIKWTKERIIDELIALHRKDVPLRANSIMEANQRLYNGFYYRRADLERAFESLSEAREQAAQNLKAKETTQVPTRYVPITAPRKHGIN